MFVNSGRAIVFMFSGMNKDLYVLGLGFSVYFIFYVYFCYGYDVAFQQFLLQCHFVASELGESVFKLHKVWDQVFWTQVLQSNYSCIVAEQFV